MSERFYSALTVSGPNAATAEHAAIEALEAIDWEIYRACWATAEEDPDRGPYFFDHTSGHSAIFPLIGVATKFPTETFVLRVDGSYGEGVQGSFTIADGGKTLVDGRSEEESYGEYPPQDLFLESTATGELREIGRENLILWWFRKARNRFHRNFRIAIYNLCPRLVEMIYGPKVARRVMLDSVTPCTPAELLRVVQGEEVNLEEILGPGTHKA